MDLSRSPEPPLGPSGIWILDLLNLLDLMNLPELLNPLDLVELRNFL